MWRHCSCQCFIFHEREHSNTHTTATVKTTPRGAVAPREYKRRELTTYQVPLCGDAAALAGIANGIDGIQGALAFNSRKRIQGAPGGLFDCGFDRGRHAGQRGGRTLRARLCTRTVALSRLKIAINGCTS